jgi:glycosyltransferase involved in cell wall biosynthesis
LKILVISYYYPPDREVGGHRARKVVEALRAAGHAVDVVAAGAKEGPPGSDGVWRVSPLLSIRDFYVRSRRWIRGRSPVPHGVEETSDEQQAASHQGSATEAVPRWKRWIFSLIWLPDDRQGFILPAVRRALTMPNGRPDLVYTTAPPFSVHLAGLAIRALTGISWVAEFRDPWTSNPWKPRFVRSAFSESAERMLERLCLGRADLLVAVSSGIAGRLRGSGTNTRIVTVRNGIERLYADGPSPDHDGPFEIVYVGSFYHTRDPFPFLRAVEGLIADRSLAPTDLQVTFIGTSERFAGRSITEYVQGADLNDFVHLEGWMDPETCLTHVRKADALLLLAVDQPDQVPNKLYEYLGARRPILAVVDEYGEAAGMLRMVGGHHLVPVNEAGRIQRALARLLDDGKRGSVGDHARLADWTTEAQMIDLTAAIGDHDVG